MYEKKETCRFPLWADKVTHQYCGCKIASNPKGVPYCEDHYKTAYDTTRTRQSAEKVATLDYYQKKHTLRISSQNVVKSIEEKLKKTPVVKTLVKKPDIPNIQIEVD